MAVTGISSGMSAFPGFLGKPSAGEGDSAVIQDLRQRDALVHRYVNSRQGTISGSIAGPNYEYTRGPDGQVYAVKANVSLNVQEVPGNPQATIINAQSARKLAGTPPILSPKDSETILRASELEAKARVEIERLATERKALYTADGKPHQPKAQPLFSLMG